MIATGLDQIAHKRFAIWIVVRMVVATLADAVATPDGQVRTVNFYRVILGVKNTDNARTAPVSVRKDGTDVTVLYRVVKMVVHVTVSVLWKTEIIDAFASKDGQVPIVAYL